MTNKKFPTLPQVECFAHESGTCTLLLDNDFGERECPFFKTKAQCEKEQAYCRERLETMKIKEEEEK